MLVGLEKKKPVDSGTSTWTSQSMLGHKNLTSSPNYMN